MTRRKMGRQSAEERKTEFRKATVLLDTLRTEFQAHLLYETAMMADSWNPDHRFVAREILGIGDFTNVKVELDRETRQRVRSMKKVTAGHSKTIDRFAKEIMKDKDVDNKKLKDVAAKLVSTSCVVTIKKHVSNPWRGPKESELLDALESLDHRVVAPMKEDLERIARDSPYESVKRAAMALLSRVA